MRKCFFYILVQAFVFVANAQGPSPLGAIYDPDPTRLRVDSLFERLEKATSDSVRVDLYILLGQAYLLRDKDSALRFTQTASDLAQKTHYPRGEFGARTRMALVFRDAGNYVNAIQLLLANLKIAENFSDTLRMYFMNQFISLVYYEMNDFARQLQYARKVQHLVEMGYFKTEADLLNYSLRGYVIPMALAFEGLGQLDSALHYWQRSHAVAVQIKDNHRIAYANIGLASTFTKEGKYDPAFAHYRTAMDYAKRAGRGYSEFAGNEDLTAQSWLGIARLFARTQSWDSAHYYGHMALRTYQQLKLPAQELKADLFLNELYARQNRTDSAYKYLVRATALQDSLFNQEKTRQVQNLQFNETLRLHQLEQERKEADEKYRVNLKLYSLFAGLALLFIAAYFLYRNNKAKQRANRLLMEQKQKVEDAYTELKAAQARLVLREKMASLGELTAGIAHEIQNPLNFVNNFSEASLELLAEMKQEIADGNYVDVMAIAENLEKNEEKIGDHGKRAASIVRGMLQHARASSGEKEPTDINALVQEYLSLSYHGLRSKDKMFNATISTNFDPAIGYVKIVSQEIGRVFLNLFNNAFYAVREKQKTAAPGYIPTVKVTTKKENNDVTVTVVDNGSGIPASVSDKIFQPFFTTKPAGEGTGLGLSLSFDIVTKGHGGELRLQSNKGDGATFEVRLPLQGNA